ncbi:hypothetical protein DdX_08044 [Ditylenchus destructor]|uniref:Uncharacterized protein n=1 Tax=Ditylenchus destructor TaxID=166010 RepID=A0AAD4R835_9BILA|nr:hypothetical protein DdX_08044 [Ditylenchus destructor]
MKTTYVSSANSENNKVQQKMLEVFGESTQEMLNLIKSRCSNDEKKSLDKRLVHKHNHELGIESGDKRTIHMFLKQVNRIVAPQAAISMFGPRDCLRV